MMLIFTWMEMLSWSVCEAAALPKCKLNYGVRSGNKQTGFCSQPVSPQPAPATRAPSCRLPFQVLCYGLQPWALVTPALVPLWARQLDPTSSGGSRGRSKSTDRSRAWWS